MKRGLNIIFQVAILALAGAACRAADTAATEPAGELHVPAFTAYLDPDRGTTHLSAERGINRWTDPAQKVLWYGQFQNAGTLNCSVALRSPMATKTRLRLTVAGIAHEAVADRDLVSFEPFAIPQAGYQCLALELVGAPSDSGAAIDALVLRGPAAANAQFNLKPRRNTASVHLSYPVPNDAKITAFYCEATALEDPVATYYEVCGWQRGYFGMQINSATERRIIFSVWDSGGEHNDRSKVAADDRTSLVSKGLGVVAGDFGHEGTGGHSHLVYAWKTGERQRFLLTVKQADQQHTIYSGFYFHPEQKKWMLIASWKAPKDGQYLRGLYSFSENFGGDNGNLRRKALFGNQWIRTTEGQWQEITSAHFSHDETGANDRFDRFMGVENGAFFLSSGGFVPGFTKYGTPFTRPATGHRPADLDLPALTR